MSAAEPELLRAFREGFEHGNRALNAGDVKTAYAALPDQVEYRLAATWPEARVLRSRDEVIEFFEDFQQTFPDARTASHEYMEGPNGTVLVGFRVSGTGRTSGAVGSPRAASGVAPSRSGISLSRTARRGMSADWTRSGSSTRATASSCPCTSFGAGRGAG
jgi:ketosteroid isomerase-like protein